VSQTRIERVAYDHADAVRLIAEVQLEYARRYGSSDDTPLDPSVFDPPRGSFYVAYLDGLDGAEPVATGAWRRRDDVHALGSTRTAEIKRMYVRPGAQRRGIARRMLAHLEATARDAGAEVMVLETGDQQPEAIALYTSTGYTSIPGFGHYRDAPENRCFAVRLQV